MKENRPLLITIHCASHRLGLPLKDAVKEISKFAEHGKFYTNMFYLFKSFIKLKIETKNTTAARNISYYTLHKVHGTSFLNHRRRCFKNILHNWPAVIIGYGNVLANNRGSSRDTRLRIKRFLIRLKSYSFLCKAAVYLAILEAEGPLPLIFEKILLMSYGISPAVEKTVLNLENLCDESLDNAIDCYLAKFFMKEEDGLTTVTSNYTKAGHDRRKPESTSKSKLILLMTPPLMKSHSIQL